MCRGRFLLLSWYWKEFKEDESGPTFSTWDPDVASYLRDYDEQFQKI